MTFAFLVFASTSIADGYGTMQLDSGERQVALIELYTSEGCSSCPPADRWLSELKSDTRLWADFVPVALHVDYWNYIGWTDRFSKSSYSDRQRAYVRNGNARASYTPGFFNNGKEWRGWFSGNALTTSSPSVGNLILGLDGNSIAVRFNSLADFNDELIVNIAILGMQLESDVRAGENNGRKLQHDFVVLNIQSYDMHDSVGGYKTIATVDDVQTEAEQLALVAWISTNNDQASIQAVGGYLP
ncbi:MAG: DUF1223 domain-containing protein [Woeseiaceae bacterium]